jgi:hypothetical protein
LSQTGNISEVFQKLNYQQILVLAYNGTLFRSRNKLLIHVTNNIINLKYILLSEKGQTPKATYFHSIYMTFLERQNYMDGK